MKVSYPQLLMFVCLKQLMEVVLASPYRTAESAFYGTGSASQEVRHVTGTASPELRHRKCVTGSASPELTSQQELRHRK